MKRLVFLLSLALFSPAFAHADGCPPQTCGTTSTVEPGSGLVLVRPSGQQGPLVAYGTGGVQRFQLPIGLLSADGTRFVASHVARGQTTLTLYDVRRGGKALLRWHLDHRLWPTTVSANGRWIVATESARGATVLDLFDTARGRIVDRVRLHGSYQPEAISPNAQMLFLIHWKRYGYDLQTFVFPSRTLRPTRLAEEPDEKMTGQAATAIASRDGHWLLTLYVGGGEDGAFVHALDLRTGLAHCIDLPWKFSDYNSASTAALALSPDQKRLYLANPLLGRVTTIDLRRVRVSRDVRFTGISNFPWGVWPSAAVTANGRMLSFSGGRHLWLYDTAYGVLRGAFAAADRAPVRTGIAANVTGLAFTRDGKHLFALTSDRTNASFEAATGRRLDVGAQAELFSIRPAAGRSVLGFDARGGPRFILPDGRLSADGSAYFTSLPRRGGDTTIQQYAPQTGRLVAERVMRGRWRLGAVSASGRWLALARHERGWTTVRVAGAAARQVLHARTLHGVFTLDAVTDDGNKLFLIQHYRRGDYAVRALDLVRGRLWTATLREKGVAEEPVMTGTAGGQVASPDGRWLLTLYLNTKEHKAFVHALNLRAAYAACIDLPSDRSLSALRDYALALAPDGGVYATNAALGVVTHIDLRREAVTDTLRFTPQRHSLNWSASALSRDGRLLYFASGRNVWRYDIARRAVDGPKFAAGPILGLAFSRDGRKVFAARADGGVAAFDAQRGVMLRA